VLRAGPDRAQVAVDMVQSRRLIRRAAIQLNV